MSDKIEGGEPLDDVHCAMIQILGQSINHLLLKKTHLNHARVAMERQTQTKQITKTFGCVGPGVSNKATLL
jgi:hypothetical protein